MVKERTPFNGEPPLECLPRSAITPIADFFARNHGNIPHLDADDYRLAITGMVDRPGSLTLVDLQTGFRPYSLTATLQCAGNRREELVAYAPIPGELPWGPGAIGTAVWTGVRLADVLTAVGVHPDAGHIHLTGLDEVERQQRRFGFGGSIPLEKAMRPEVLLAYEMNGKPLTVEHGAPLRMVVPGYIGARSVKWLGEIGVFEKPSENYFYAHAYQLFPSWESADRVDWSSGIKLGEHPINSVICLPKDGERITQNSTCIQGYAFTGGGRRVERVDVSIDGGQSWLAAGLGEEIGPWAWRFWQADVHLPNGETEIIARAWDSAANSQPSDIGQVWNFKGYMNTAWHRVRVRVDA